MMNKHGESARLDVAGHILERVELVEIELREEANALKDSAHEIIRRARAEMTIKPPATLTVKSFTGIFGPRIIWITYSPKKIGLRTGFSVRFTREIRGRKNGRYPRTIFKGYPDEVADELWAIEQQAAKLRGEISYWRDLIKKMRTVAAEEGRRC